MPHPTQVFPNDGYALLSTQWSLFSLFYFAPHSFHLHTPHRHHCSGNIRYWLWWRIWQLDVVELKQHLFVCYSFVFVFHSCALSLFDSFLSRTKFKPRKMFLWVSLTFDSPCFMVPSLAFALVRNLEPQWIHPPSGTTTTQHNGFEPSSHIPGPLVLTVHTTIQFLNIPTIITSNNLRCVTPISRLRAILSLSGYLKV